MKPHLFFVLICFTLLLSCKKDKAEPAADVYLAGFEVNNVPRQVGKVWKNGEVFQIVSNGSFNSDVYSVFVTPSNDVYAAGWSYDGNYYFPTLWKNGVQSTLNVGNTVLRDNYAYDVFATANDVYVVGRIGQTRFGRDSSVVVLWKNGIPSLVTNGALPSIPRDVFVENNDVYIVGEEENSAGRTVAKLWKNNIPFNLSSGGTDAVAAAVYVHQGDVYVAGREVNSAGVDMAKLWKNGVATTLSDVAINASARDVYVSSSGDVYVSGYEGRSAVVWKNGVATKITDGFTFALASTVFVHQGNVYAAGYETQPSPPNAPGNARLWKNGVAMDLQLENLSKDSQIYSVFVK